MCGRSGLENVAQPGAGCWKEDTEDVLLIPNGNFFERYRFICTLDSLFNSIFSSHIAERLSVGNKIFIVCCPFFNTVNSGL